MPNVSDPRIAWIEGRVLLGLGLDEAEFRHLLGSTDSAKTTTARSEIATGPCAVEILREFLGTKAGVGSSLFFYSEMESAEEPEEYEEEYQESEPIEVPQQLGDPTPSPETGPVAQTLRTSEGNMALSSKPSPEDIAAEPIEISKVPGLLSDEAAGDGSRETGPATVAEVRVVTKTRKAVRMVLGAKRRCRLTQGTLPDISERIVYLVKIMGGEVARPTSGSEHGSMVAAMEYGCLAGDCLTNLSNVVKEVFAPLLDHQLGLGVLASTAVGGGDKLSSEAAANLPQDAPKVGDNLRNEFRANLHKFESQVTHATQQVKGVHLSVPNINTDDPDIGNDFEAVSLLEGAMEEWSRLIAAVVETENLKRVKGRGPMAEIEFWRRRNASLSALYEQINMPKVIL